MEAGSLTRRRAILFGFPLSAAGRRVRPLILISANAEWKSVKELLRPPKLETSPHGEWFAHVAPDAIFFHGGWGKIAAAASTEYAIARWNPKLLVNLGTCGGVAGEIERYAIVLADKTVVYDIVEMMGDSAEAIRDYSTDLDLSWLPADIAKKLPADFVRATLLSADKDLDPAELSRLRANYGIRAADWESGAIAWVAVRKHRRRLLILRGVSDLVSESSGGQAYGKPEEFVNGTREVMQKLLRSLPAWLPQAARVP